MSDLIKYLQQHPKKLLIFDFDETLFTLDLPWHIYHQRMGEEMRAFDSGVKEQQTLNDFENLVVQTIGQQAVEKRRAVSLWFEKNYLKGYEEHRYLTNFIRKNYQHYEGMYLWSSNSRETIETILNDTDLTQLFSKIVTKDDVFQTKPNPEGFESFIYSKDKRRSDYLFVGNSANDRAAADSAGIDFFLVNHVS